MIAFHNITARYMFSLGRERVLPAAFGRTSLRTGSPRVASLTQSLVGMVVILVYAIGGFDPLVQLFYWGGASGGFGVLLLICATSIAVIGYFARQPSGEPLWRRTIDPLLAAGVLLVVLYVVLLHFKTLLGVPTGHALRWGVPATYVVIAALGVAWGLVLRASRPQVYAAIGRGAKITTGEQPVAAVREGVR